MTSPSPRPSSSPGAEILVVTTPQQAAAEVAERAGAIALQTHQRLAGVIENMSWLELPDGTRQEIFGSGGGRDVAESLTRAIGAEVPLLGQIPLDTRLRIGADQGMPVVLGEPDSPAAVALRGIAKGLATRSRGLAGRRWASLPPVADRLGQAPSRGVDVVGRRPRRVPGPPVGLGALP